MKILGRVFIVSLIILSFLFIRVDKTTSPEPPLSSEAILSMVNFYRAEHNIKPLLQDDRLCEYGTMRVDQIISTWSHDGFSNDGGQEDLICPDCTFFGENLARRQTSNQQIIKEWKGSPGHNAAMLDPRWDIACVSLKVNNGISYTTLEFADLD